MGILGGLLLGAAIGGLIGWSIVKGGSGTVYVPTPRPTIHDVLGKGVDTMTVSWTYPDAESADGWTVALPLRFDIARIAPTQGTVMFSVPAAGFTMSADDTGLIPSTSYTYRVRAVFGSGPHSWSIPKTGSTLAFLTSFDDALTSDEGGWGGRTLVQRIEPVRLNRSGTQVRLTLRASSFEACNIERIVISQPDPAANDPYDAAGDLTLFYGKARLPANSIVTLKDTLPNVKYTLDASRPLLIAVEFAPGLPSGVKFRDAVSPEHATAYFQDGAEAPVRDRTTGYSQATRLYLIERIEVG